MRGVIYLWSLEGIFLGSQCRVVKDGRRSSGGYSVDVHNEDSLTRYDWKPETVTCRYTWKIVIGSIVLYGPCAKFVEGRKKSKKISK